MNVNRFIAVASMTTEELFDSVYQFLATIYPEVHKSKFNEYIYAQGQSSVCLVAHLDTVFPVPPKKFYRAKFDKNVIMGHQGLGADDRAGVYAILELIKMGLRPSVIFTTGEETGGEGAFELLSDHRDCPINTSCLIELDRRGKNDSIFYECGNEDFKEFINSFGFKTNYGAFTDISILAPDWDLAAVNLSIGFKNEHTIYEKLNTKHTDLTIQKVSAIIESEPEYYNYQEDLDFTLYKKCFVCIHGNCDDCETLDEHRKIGGFDGSQGYYHQGRDYAKASRSSA